VDEVVAPVEEDIRAGVPNLADARTLLRPNNSKRGSNTYKNDDTQSKKPCFHLMNREVVICSSLLLLLSNFLHRNVPGIQRTRDRPIPNCSNCPGILAIFIVYLETLAYISSDCSHITDI
jgi:hypothetical protein